MPATLVAAKSGVPVDTVAAAGSGPDSRTPYDQCTYSVGNDAQKQILIQIAGYPPGGAKIGFDANKAVNAPSTISGVGDGAVLHGEPDTLGVAVALFGDQILRIKPYPAVEDTVRQHAEELLRAKSAEPRTALASAAPLHPNLITRAFDLLELVPPVSVVGLN